MNSLLKLLRSPRTMMVNFSLAIRIILVLAFSLFLITLVFGFYERNPWYWIELLMGNSMEPVINRYDLVITIPQQTGNLEPGMIIYFQNPDGDPIIHRIVAITEEGCYVTKGDANPDVDHWLTAEGEKYQVCQVMRRYIGKIPVGRALRILRTLGKPRTE